MEMAWAHHHLGTSASHFTTTIVYVLVLPPSPLRHDSDVSSDSGYLLLFNSLPSRLSPQCAVKEVSQEDIDMALFGFTSSVLVARKEITQQDIDEALFGP